MALALATSAASFDCANSTMTDSAIMPAKASFLLRSLNVFSWSKICWRAYHSLFVGGRRNCGNGQSQPFERPFLRGLAAAWELLVQGHEESCVRECHLRHNRRCLSSFRL